jgi:hypothetical protein
MKIQPNQFKVNLNQFLSCQSIVSPYQFILFSDIKSHIWVVSHIWMKVKGTIRSDCDQAKLFTSNAYSSDELEVIILVCPHINYPRKMR